MALEALLVTALVTGIGSWQARDLVPEGAAAPTRALPGLAGGEVAVGGGPVTLVYFFAPWCAVCKLASGNLAWIARVFGPDRLRIVPVALDYESRAQVAAYVEEHPFPGAVALGDDATRQAFRVTAFPTYYVLDAGLAIRHGSVGYSTLLGLLARILLTSA